MNKLSKKKGFTLIEILVVIGIIALLATIVLIAINPARQFAQARDTQRVSNLNTLLNGVGQYIADNKGLSTCLDTAGLNATAKTIRSGGVVATDIDARACLVTKYIQELPVDPSTGVAWDGTNYNTGYKILKDANGRIHLISDSDELNIPRTDDIEVVR